MPCPEIQTFEDYLNGDLPPAESATFREHTQSCAACSKLLAQESAIAELLSSQPLLKAPLNLRAQVLATLQQKTAASNITEWLWAIGGGLVVAVVGWLAVELCRQALPGVEQYFNGLLNSGDVAAHLKTLLQSPNQDFIVKFSTGNTVLLTNFILASSILCWGLWQMVKAIRS